MTEINDQLKSAQSRGLLLAIYHYFDDETFSVGRILQQDDTHVLLEVVDPNGSFNGLQLISKDFINRVVLRSDYLRSTEVWQQAANRDGYADPWQIEQTKASLNLDDNALLRSLLQNALRKELVLSLGTVRQVADDNVTDADFTGLVAEYVGDAVALNYLDPWDLTDAWQIDIKTDEINYLRVGAGVCERMKALLAVYGD
ncbi:hypothetical protein [Furfurilactobacillus siliginis]|uniref:Uncharacterized protein n=1 Tax=Furfurilactobacillus siliginis TaxID=348151 RepID=A0A0R2KW01_9LACO|nr:hypothetical protein [Furfurilactobacillus siliginis]KRN93682.1 hypothetical protein IV55_GL000991 [Furfurilactobacillus siliginis]GEK28388.1 hypothetical protein LSI01_06990 [Furfurilactobacillus siliginis]